MKVMMAVAFLALGVATIACADTASGINKMYNFPANLHGISEVDTVTLHIYGTSFNAPFKWAITIGDNASSRLFFVEYDDAWLDSFFGDEGYVDGCSGYDACKRKWYFNDLPDRVKNSAGFFNSEIIVPEGWRIESLQLLANDFLKHKGLFEKDRASVVKEMTALLTVGYNQICPPYTPVQDGACSMYVPSLGYFVPYWDD